MSHRNARTAGSAERAGAAVAARHGVKRAVADFWFRKPRSAFAPGRPGSWTAEDVVVVPARRAATGARTQGKGARVRHCGDIKWE